MQHHSAALLPPCHTLYAPQASVFDGYDFDKSGRIEYHEYMKYNLRDALARSAGRVVDLFHSWDDDGSGSITKKEFRAALRKSGFDAPTGAMNALFDELDATGDGSVDFREMHRALRQGAAVKKLDLGATYLGQLGKTYEASSGSGRGAGPEKALTHADLAARREAARKEWAARGRKKLASPRMRVRPIYGDGASAVVGV